MTEIQNSMLDVRCSTFISFFFDETGRPPKAGKFFWLAAGLNTGTRNLTPKKRDKIKGSDKRIFTTLESNHKPC